jgi:hypothetical protein
MQWLWILVTRQEARKQDSGLGLAAAEEYKRWDGEDFTSDYSEIATVIINCNSSWRISNNSRYKIRNPLIIRRVTSLTRHNIFKNNEEI